MERVHLYRRGQAWWVSFTFEGKRVRQSLKTDNRKIAQDLRAELEYKIRAKTYHLPQNIPLENFLDEYWAYKKPRRSHAGYLDEKNRVRHFFDDTGIRYLNQVTAQMITAYLTKYKAKGRSPKTVNDLRAFLHTLFEYAMKQGYLTVNPVRNVSRFEEPQRSIRFVKTKAEIKKLLGFFEGDPVQPLVATIVYAGLRVSEAAWLTWDDIDLKRRVLYIRDKQTDGDQWHPKTGRNRVVPVSKTLYSILKRHCAQRNGLPWVFPSPMKSRWDRNNLSEQFSKKLRKARLPWTLRDLRHTFGSQLAMRGVSLYKISAFMGNSPDVCRQHYAALIPEDLHKDVEF